MGTSLETVCIYCDNKSVVAVCKLGGIKDAMLNKSLHVLFNNPLLVVKTSGCNNRVANALSHNKFIGNHYLNII